MWAKQAEVSEAHSDQHAGEYRQLIDYREKMKAMFHVAGAE